MFCAEDTLFSDQAFTTESTKIRGLPPKETKAENRKSRDASADLEVGVCARAVM
jgi:hypothetical protein